MLTKIIRAALALATSLMFSINASAAEISFVIPEKEGEQTFILIQGEIKSGDDEKFRKIAAQYSEATVLLDSEGGAIGPAMDIGRTIRLRGYMTAVTSNQSCASACALIWIAGSQRVIIDGGQVGFHASYFDENGTKLETGVGNALVGHYLSQLGFGEKTVVFATLAPPDKILWLNENTLAMSGIDYNAISVELPSSSGEKRTVPSKTTDAQRAPTPALDAASISNSADYGQFMGAVEPNLRSPDAFLLALRQKGFQATINKDNPESPTINVGVSGEQIAVSFSGCDPKGCDYVQLIIWYIGVTRKQANAVMVYSFKTETYSHPLWLEDTNVLVCYNYIVIGANGISVQTLIDNMNYFVEANKELVDAALEEKAK